MKIPLVRINVQQCGCNIWWYAGEVTPGRGTIIDQVYLCPSHKQQHWNELICGNEDFK
jgi:hypothetical protein